jgi:hypothetical protein
MKLLEFSIAYDVGALLFFSVWLWVLIRRRDLWLRYTAAEAAFSARFHLPPRLIAACRRFGEGRAVIYFTIICLGLSLLMLITSIGMCVYIKERQHQNQPTTQIGCKFPSGSSLAFALPLDAGGQRIIVGA